MSFILEKIINIPIVLISLMVHELAHGWVSVKQGDPTPKLAGRMTFNPLDHLDPIGTLLMIFTGFGWAKPVPINPRYYKDSKKGMALVAFAGPLSNLLLAFAALIIYAVIFILYVKLGIFTRSLDSIGFITNRFITMNLCFAVFNMIPIPPLDGSRILGLFLSTRAYFKFQEYERYSFMLIILLSAMGVFSRIIGTGVAFLYSNMFGLIEKIVTLVV